MARQQRGAGDPTHEQLTAAVAVLWAAFDLRALMGRRQPTKFPAHMRTPGGGHESTCAHQGGHELKH
eukprot:11302891-Heterocapsa_arctica.AAC.1